MVNHGGKSGQKLKTGKEAWSRKIDAYMLSFHCTFVLFLIQFPCVVLAILELSIQNMIPWNSKKFYGLSLTILVLKAFTTMPGSVLKKI